MFLYIQAYIFVYLSSLKQVFGSIAGAGHGAKQPICGYAEFVCGFELCQVILSKHDFEL